jgi:hypothetical protein
MAEVSVCLRGSVSNLAGGPVKELHEPAWRGAVAVNSRYEQLIAYIPFTGIGHNSWIGILLRDSSPTVSDTEGETPSLVTLTL